MGCFMFPMCGFLKEFLEAPLRLLFKFFFEGIIEAAERWIFLMNFWWELQNVDFQRFLGFFLDYYYPWIFNEFF